MRGRNAQDIRARNAHFGYMRGRGSEVNYFVLSAFSRKRFAVRMDIGRRVQGFISG
jgi:hypothetical protein